jgi:putative hydrolase of the HAD superfamily
MKRMKAILFDLDNTLIDFKKMKEEACKSALEAMTKKGLKIPFKTGYKKLMKIYFRVGIESNIAFEEFLKSETDQVETKILAAGINEYLKTKNKFLKPYQNVKSTLKKLKKLGLKLAIVTDAPRLKAYQRLVAMGIDDYFDFVIGFEDTGRGKASQLPFKVAIERLKIKPEDVMMISDSVSRDLIGARKLGMATVLAKYGQVWKETEKSKADFEINGINEILKIV